MLRSDGPKQKRADLHPATLRKKGVFNRKPAGEVLEFLPVEGCVFPRGFRAGVVQW